jgi:PAS domain S-box-containing protein
MIRNVVTADVDTSLSAIINKMYTHNISCTVICADNKPLGIITERDITRILADKNYDGSVLAGKIIKKSLITISRKVTIYEATKLMRKKNIRRLVVINEKGQLVGLITESDIVKHLERDYLESLRNIAAKERTYINNIKEGIWECSPHLEGIFIWTNMAGTQILGYNKTQAIVGKKIKDVFVNPEDLDCLFHELEDNGVAKDFNAVLKKSDGSHFHAEGTFYYIKDDEGNVVCLEGIIRDVSERKEMENQLKKYSTMLEKKVEVQTAKTTKTYEELQNEVVERKQVQKALQQSERELKIRNRIAEIFLTVPDEKMYFQVLKIIMDAVKSKYGIFGYIDQKGNFVCPSLVENILNECGISQKDFIRKKEKWAGLWSRTLGEKKTFYSNGPFDVPQGHIYIERVMAVPIINRKGAIGLIIVANKENSYDEKDKTLLESISHHIAPVLYARLEADKRGKERKQAEEKLKKTSEKLRNLSTHLQFAREEERTNIAREIHDELGQQLTALHIDLSDLITELSQNQLPLIKKTEAMLNLVDTSIQTVQRISSNLRPSILDNLGVIAAIKLHAEEFQVRTGIKCTLATNNDDLILDQDRSTAVFRIYQESLTNIARHAKATIVKTKLKEENGSLILIIRDNGKGILEEQTSSPRSFGIIGMKERARFVGGTLAIEGNKNKGTLVKAIIPNIS